MSIIKKVFIFSSLGLALILLFWGLYYFVFKPAPGKKSASESVQEAQAVPLDSGRAKEKMLALTDEEVLAPALNEDSTGIKYYSKKDQGFYEITFSGEIRNLLLKKDLPGIEGIFWSPNRKQAIFKFVSVGTDPHFTLFNFETKKGTPLKNNLDSVYWHNDDKIIYKYYDPAKKERTLNMADPDGTNWKKLADLEFRNLSVSPIPKSGEISFWQSPDAYNESVLRSTSLVSGETKVLFQGKFGADFLWNPEGSSLILSHSNERAGKKIQLGLINNNGGEYKNLEIPTFVSKCAWSRDGKTIYYAQPGSIPENSILPNDYLSGKFNTIDTFWKINLQNGEKIRLIDLEKIPERVDAKDLFLSLDESGLFFTNRSDGKLYRINL